MSIKAELRQEVTKAMRAGDHFRRDTLRVILAEIKQAEVDGQTTLDDEQVLALLARQVRQRQETIRDANKAGRPEMAAAAQAEIDLLQAYLPKMMSLDELRPIVAQIIAEVGAVGMKDMGRLMGVAVPRLEGRADNRSISQVARELLSR